MRHLRPAVIEATIPGLFGLVVPRPVVLGVLLLDGVRADIHSHRYGSIRVAGLIFGITV